jgi:anti-anti-sigma regulatory factor/HAMP domain-containing protein
MDQRDNSGAIETQSLEGLMRWKLATKIIMSIGGLLIGLSIGVAVLTFIQVRQTAFAELETRGFTLANTLNYTFEVLLGQNAFSGLQRLTENSATLPNVKEVLIVARNKKILAGSAREKVNTELQSSLMNMYLDQADWQAKKYLTENNELVIIQPLRGGRFLGGMEINVIGATQVTLDRRDIEAVARGAALQLLGISLGSYLLLSIILALVLHLLVVQPLQHLATIAGRFRQGQRSLRSRISRRDEIGLLSATFDDMADEVETTLSGLEDQVAHRTADLEQQRAALSQALDNLRASTDERLSLIETIRQLSTPVIQVYEHIILIPLIGIIDATRMEQIETAMLMGIEKSYAQKVILDLTGVPIIDTNVAAFLARLPRLAQLLGAEVTMVGIAPEVAESLVHLGVDFSGTITRSNLQSGVLYALRSLGFVIRQSETNAARYSAERRN